MAAERPAVDADAAFAAPLVCTGSAGTADGSAVAVVVGVVVAGRTGAGGVAEAAVRRLMADAPELLAATDVGDAIVEELVLGF